jgi:hypothetical protein
LYSFGYSRKNRLSVLVSAQYRGNIYSVTMSVGMTGSGVAATRIPWVDSV